MQKMHAVKPLLITRNSILMGLVTIALAACGGGGGGSDSPPTGQTPMPTPSASISPSPNPSATPSPSSSPNPSPDPTVSPAPGGAGITIDPLGAVDTPNPEFRGTSQGVTGPITFQINDRTYTVTPGSDGRWSLRLDVCEDRLSTGRYTLNASAVDTAGNTQEASRPVSIEGQFVILNYLRRDQDYANWGLHLWGDALDESVRTNWPVIRPFDCRIGEWASFLVPYIDRGAPLNFLFHFGDLKSPNADLSLVPEDSETTLWIVEENTTLFSDRVEAENSRGNASAALDLSHVPAGRTVSDLEDGWNRSANFMQIFVRSYQDSDGDGVGDINGLRQRLGYLAELGITGLWLMPMMESSDGDHGYAVTDYRSIEADYGSLEDFRALINEAHDLDIGIVLDYVVNHSSSANPLFLDANFSAENSRRDWYIFREQNPGWSGPFGSVAWHSGNNNDFYYGAFFAGMPDFDLGNAEVENYHFSSLRFWMNMGVDGFRIDASGVLFEDEAGLETEDNSRNFTFLRKMLDVVNEYDNRFLVCESPANPAEYAGEDACGNAFAFQVQGEILRSALDRRFNGTLRAQLLRAEHAHMPLFLSNHDSFAGPRPYTWLTNNASIDNSNVDGYLRVASAINILASSTPFTYYGEEIGTEGANSSDPNMRRPMSWTNDGDTAGFTNSTPYRAPAANVSSRNVENQRGDAASLWSHYQALYRLRNAHPDIFGPGGINVQSELNASHLVFTRGGGERLAAVFINLSNQSQTLTANVSLFNRNFDVVLRSGSGEAAEAVSSDSNGFVSANVGPQSVLVLIAP